MDESDIHFNREDLLKEKMSQSAAEPNEVVPPSEIPSTTDGNKAEWLFELLGFIVEVASDLLT